MTIEAEPIHVEPGEPLAALLDKARDNAVRLEKEGVIYRLSVDRPAQWEGYNPAAVRDDMAATTGSWSDIDPEQLKASIYRAREEGTRRE